MLKRRSLVTFLIAFALLVPTAHADVFNDDSTNAQDGDNDNGGDQDGDAESGDAIVGQVAGVNSSGDTSVDATNHTEDSSAESGDADGENSAASLVGLVVASDTLISADVLNGFGVNVQDGDNGNAFAQRGIVQSGDAVAGQVAGVTTAAGGTTDLVLANTTIDADIETGDADLDNTAAAKVGLFADGIPDEGTATGLILNISDASAPEDTPGGLGTLVFTVSVKKTKLSKNAGKGAGAAGLEEPQPTPGPGAITFTYTTKDGSASTECPFDGSTDCDYDAVHSGSGFIAAGSTSTTISIDANDDDSADCEGDQTFTVELTGASIPIGDGTGTGTITEGGC